MAEKEKKKRNIRTRILAIVCGVLLFVAAVLGSLQLGVFYTGKTWKHWYADYQMQDISLLLVKPVLEEEDYQLIYTQTGLTKLAVDDMRGDLGGRLRILNIQRAFFKDYEVTSRHFAPFTYMDEIDGSALLCDLKDGDIIVSATTRVSWWRYGHACIVIDGKLKLIAESIGPGEDSEIASAGVCESYADFLVLRPKVDEETKAQVVEYIREEMIGLPYRFTVGILSKKYQKKLKSTQCAHFVWYAYKKFGVDLDGNGGGLVKPQDIARSNQVELVQAFGFDLEKLWK